MLVDVRLQYKVGSVTESRNIKDVMLLFKDAMADAPTRGQRATRWVMTGYPPQRSLLS